MHNGNGTVHDGRSSSRDGKQNAMQRLAASEEGKQDESRRIT